MKTQVVTLDILILVQMSSAEMEGVATMMIPENLPLSQTSSTWRELD